jgi:hypothetical protein
MRNILLALALGISISAIASPALAESGDDKVDRGIDQILSQSERDLPQISVGVVAGSDEPQRPGVYQEQRYENQDSR